MLRVGGLPRVLVGTALLLAAGTIVGLLLAARSGRGVESPPSPESRATSSQEIPGARVIDDLGAGGGQAYALRWIGEDELWYVRGEGGTGGLELVRLRLSDGSSQRFSLGVADQLGASTALVDNAGVLWLATNYTIVAFDASKGVVVAHESLPLEHELSDSGALDPGDPLPGTWINGLAVDVDGSLVVTRNHVRGVFSLGPGGLSLASILPVAPRGLVRVGGRPAAFGPGLEAAVQLEGAPAPVEPGGLYDDTAACSLALKPGTGDLILRGRSTTSTTNVGSHPSDRLASAAAGTLHALGLNGTGRVVRVNCETGSIQEVELPTVTVTNCPTCRVTVVSCPSCPGGHTLPQSFTSRPVVLAIAISPKGRVAFSTHVGQIHVVD